MRFYSNLYDAVRETERDIFELGINVHPQSMQDKDVHNNPDYMTKEIRGYAFKLIDVAWDKEQEDKVLQYILRDKHAVQHASAYIQLEFLDRVSGKQLNPGNSFQERREVWDEFLHDGKFSYTYSERIALQLHRIERELVMRPETRQAIINIHSNICPIVAENVHESQDLKNTGGTGRIPCSMYYQFMRREGKLDLIYTMRSCDFLTHFPIDLSLAMRLQDWMANRLEDDAGALTFFTGSLHAYMRDMKQRGIY
jgi:thymidylate synthase